MPSQVVVERCIGCEICERRCPMDVIRMAPLPEPALILGRKVRKVARIVYPDECWHCGVCRLDCPTDAITYVFPDAMLAGPSAVEPLAT